MGIMEDGPVGEIKPLLPTTDLLTTSDFCKHPVGSTAGAACLYIECSNLELAIPNPAHCLYTRASI
jgi:hypothetical protein